LKALCRDNSYA